MRKITDLLFTSSDDYDYSSEEDDYSSEEDYGSEENEFKGNYDLKT